MHILDPMKTYKLIIPRFAIASLVAISALLIKASMPAQVLAATGSFQVEYSGDKLQTYVRTETKVFKLINARADEIFPMVERVLTIAVDLHGNQRSVGRVDVNSGFNLLIVTDLPEKLKSIGEMIFTLDHADYKGFPNLETRMITINFAKASEIASQITQRLTNKGKANSFDDQHLLIIQDVSSNIDYLEKIIAKLDVQRRQIHVTGKVVDIFEGEGYDWGLQGGLSFAKDKVDINPTLNANKGFTEGVAATFAKAGKITFDAKLNAMVRDGRARVVSNFGITVLDNETANFYVVDAAYVSKDPGNSPKGNTGVNLRISPRVNSEKLITIDLEIAVDGLSLDPITNEPFTARSVANTTIIFRTDQNFLIGGLKRNRVFRRRGGIPFLKDIPLLGLLFSRQSYHKSESQVAILISASLLSPDEGGELP